MPLINTRFFGFKQNKTEFKKVRPSINAKAMKKLIQKSDTLLTNG